MGRPADARGNLGRTVHVVAGKGNNGNDGRAAAARLRQWGVHVEVHGADSCPSLLEPADLVIDAAFGTGFHGEWWAPHCRRRAAAARPSLPLLPLPATTWTVRPYVPPSIRLAAHATAVPARPISTSTGSGAAASTAAISAGVTIGITPPNLPAPPI